MVFSGTIFIVILSSEEPDAKKVKEEEAEEEYNLADIAEGSVSSVSNRKAGWRNRSKDGL